MGDFHPYWGLASAFQRRGHRVTLVTHPMLAEFSRNAGMDCHTVGTVEEAEAALHNPALWDARKGFEVVWKSVAPRQKDIAEFLLGLPADEETVVIAHPLVLPGASVAREQRPAMRLIGTYLAPANLRTCHDPLQLGPLHVPRWVPQAVRRWLWRRIDADLLDPATLPDINTLRAHFGLASVPNYAGHLYGAPDFAVTLFPAWFGPTQPDWPTPLLRGDFLLFDGFTEAALAPDLEEFLAAGEAPLVFTFGSAMLHAGRAFRESVAACRRLGRRGILLSAFPEQIPGDLPPSVRWFEYVPFRRLLPHAAALIHHGGVGSMAEALRAGVPQVIVPMAHDQFDNAMRIEALGVGRSVPRSGYGSRRVAKCIAGLLAEPRLDANCRAAAARFADPQPADSVCAQIEAALA